MFIIGISSLITWLMDRLYLRVFLRIRLSPTLRFVLGYCRITPRLRIMTVTWSRHLLFRRIPTSPTQPTRSGERKLRPLLWLALNSNSLRSFVIVLVIRIIIPCCISVFLFLVLIRLGFRHGLRGRMLLLWWSCWILRSRIAFVVLSSRWDIRNWLMHLILIQRLLRYNLVKKNLGEKKKQ